jgi:hypothetical protein
MHRTLLAYRVLLAALAALAGKPASGIDPACHRLHSLVPAAEARTDVADVLNVTYLSRTLKVHSSDMVGEFSAEAHAETGAAAQGFVLADRVQPKGRSTNRALHKTRRDPIGKVCSP